MMKRNQLEPNVFAAAPSAVRTIARAFDLGSDLWFVLENEAGGRAG